MTITDLGEERSSCTTEVTVEMFAQPRTTLSIEEPHEAASVQTTPSIAHFFAFIAVGLHFDRTKAVSANSVRSAFFASA
uniref:Uncharacterized protein n=1 Tax=Panagrellus redivivus TaxID=6233 RepID=A0A7E4VFW8_PANRE